MTPTRRTTRGLPSSRLRAIRSRLAAATPGPWAEDDGNVFWEAAADDRFARIHASMDGGPPYRREDDVESLVCKCSQDLPNFDPDSQFIAHARQDVEDLLVEVTRLRAVVWRLRQDAGSAPEGASAPVTIDPVGGSRRRPARPARR